MNGKRRQRIAEGAPPPKPFQMLRPTAKVLIDLSALYPEPPHHKTGYAPEGFEAHKIVAGDLIEWSLTTSGTWPACVTYSFESMYRTERVTHWVTELRLEADVARLSRWQYDASNVLLGGGLL